MPNYHIVRTTPVKKSYRVDSVIGIFDIPNMTEVKHEWDVSLPLENKKWNIGLIVGNSGSGKTVIASEIFKDFKMITGFKWKKDDSFLNDFNKDIPIKKIIEVLNNIGLSSPVAWLKSWHTLSNGQKFRVDMVRAILSEYKNVVIDEFTSVIDRDVAKTVSHCLQKVFRKNFPDKKIVLLSCHYDIIEWLQPDWIYDVTKNEFNWRSLQGRPKIKLKIYKTDRSMWKIFRGNHYLSADIADQAQCFVAYWENKPVAFTSYVHFPHSSSMKYKREHRTVVLPDYQGVGIGNILSEWLGNYLTKKGFIFISTTSHPAMIFHRSRSPKWQLRRLGHCTPNNIMHKKISSFRRLTASFRYIEGRK